MKYKSSLFKEADMINDSPFRSLFIFAIPLVLSSCLQRFYDIMSSMIVGKFVGEEGLAVVGTGSPPLTLALAVAIGLSSGAGVYISQLYGARKNNEMKTSIYSAIIFISLLSLVITAFCVVTTEKILVILNTPSNIFGQSTQYLKAFYLCMPPLFIFNILNSIFIAIGEVRKPMIILVFVSILNALLVYIFVKVLHSGVMGVVYAAMIARTLSAVVLFICLFKKLKHFNTTGKVKKINLIALKSMCLVAIPSMVSESVVGFGVLLVQSIINSYGSAVMAGYLAATRIDSVTLAPLVSIGNAVSTFAAQNIGADQKERVIKGYKSGIVIVIMTCLSSLTLIIIFGRQLMSCFLNSDSGSTGITVGLNYLHIVSVFYVFLGIMHATNGILRGAGDIKYYMISNMTDLALRVILAYILSPIFGIGAVWVAVPIGRAIASAISFKRLKTGRWKEVQMIQ